jgi:hypothetical protein
VFRIFRAKRRGEAGAVGCRQRDPDFHPSHAYRGRGDARHSTELTVLHYKIAVLEGDRSKMEEAVDNPERYAAMSVGFLRSMRRFAVSPILAVALVSGIAAQAEPGEVKNLAPGVYVWQGDRDKREPANCMWVIFNDYVLVVDANFPWGAREILPKIRATTNKPIRFVLNTHYHGDHAYGNAIFVDAGAMIVSSEATDKEARTRGADGWAKWNDEAHSLKDTREDFASLTFSDHLVFDAARKESTSSVWAPLTHKATPWPTFRNSILWRREISVSPGPTEIIRAMPEAAIRDG